MSKVKENVMFLNSESIPSTLTTLYTVPSDIDRIRIDYCRIMNSTAVPKSIQILFVPVGGGSGTGDSTVFGQRIGASESLLITEAIGEWIDGGGEIRADSNAVGTTLTVNGTTWDIGS